MATKAKSDRLTIKGIARWPKLKTPDSYNGNIIGYTIQVEPTEEEFNRIKKELELTLDKAKADKEFEGKVWLDNPSMGIIEGKEGELLFKFKKAHEYKDKKTGDLVKMTVPIYDKHGVPVDVEVGNGSEVVVAFTPRPYHMSKNNNGLSLRLDAVQVLELKTRGIGAEMFGFDVEDLGVGIEENPFA